MEKLQEIMQFEFIQDTLVCINEFDVEIGMDSQANLGAGNLEHLFRVIHNIKGNSKAVGFDEIALLATSVESLLLESTLKKIPLDKINQNLVLSSYEKIKKLVLCYAQGLKIEESDIDAIYISKKIKLMAENVSKSLNKKIEFHFDFDNNPIDIELFKKVRAPLLQLIHNSCDHGIEDERLRKKSGKSSVGNIEILFYQKGSKHIFQFTDDGAGINLDEIKKLAIEKGLIKKEDKKTNSELLQYIFHSGLTTKATCSDISGRGVGMDIIKSHIEKHGGDIRVQSKSHVGCSFQLILPIAG